MTACVLVLGVLYRQFDPQQFRITVNNSFMLLAKASVPSELIFVDFLEGSQPQQKRPCFEVEELQSSHYWCTDEKTFSVLSSAC
jgi:hypothetical protein